MSEKQAPPPYGMHPSAPTGMYPTLPVAHPQMQQPTVYVAGPPTVMSVPVGPHSSRMTCPSCNASISTRVEKESTTKTHLIALLLCVLFFWPCVCVPYCMDSCKATNHYCPSCGAFLGSYTN